MYSNYQCKKATIEEVKEKWEYECKIHKDNPKYIPVMKQFIEEIEKGTRISYVGKLKGKIICDATVIIKKEGIKKEATRDDVVSKKRAYLCALRTNKEYEGKGYFSKLYHYIEKELKKEGYQELSLSVEVSETRNLMIYFKWGYTNYMGSDILYGDNKRYIYNYYYKKL